MALKKLVSVRSSPSVNTRRVAPTFQVSLGATLQSLPRVAGSARTTTDTVIGTTVGNIVGNTSTTTGNYYQHQYWYLEHHH